MASLFAVFSFSQHHTPTCSEDDQQVHDSGASSVPPRAAEADGDLRHRATPRFTLPHSARSQLGPPGSLFTRTAVCFSLAFVTPAAHLLTSDTPSHRQKHFSEATAWKPEWRNAPDEHRTVLMRAGRHRMQRGLGLGRVFRWDSPVTSLQQRDVSAPAAPNTEKTHWVHNFVLKHWHKRWINCRRKRLNLMKVLNTPEQFRRVGVFYLMKLYHCIE